jgi:hypothetical protein
MVARPDVDAGRMAVIGISQAGYRIPRALAFEHRFAAAVADPGVVDVSTAWMEPLPSPMRRELKQAKRAAFDRNMHVAERFSAKTRALMSFRGEPYGVDDGSRFELYETVAQYRLDGPREIVRFTAEEGAGRHCEPLASALRDARVFDWLDGLPAPAGLSSASGLYQEDVVIGVRGREHLCPRRAKRAAAIDVLEAGGLAG